MVEAPVDRSVITLRDWPAAQEDAVALVMLGFAAPLQPLTAAYAKP